MDAFESVVGEILWRDGYWVRTSFKVELTRDDKIAIERPSSPRWELDIVGYSSRRNQLLIVECKSYLNSPGVRSRGFNGKNDKFSTRFKLFNDDKLREVVTHRLREQLLHAGLIRAKPTVALALACGNIASDRARDLLRERFKQDGWLLWDEDWLKAKLQDMSEGDYENSVVAVVAKLLLRN